LKTTQFIRYDIVFEKKKIKVLMDKARVKWVQCEFGELEGIVTTLYKFLD
jgi:hypothetical protein